MYWEELTQIALFGSSRKQPSNALLQELATRGIDLENLPEEVVLDGIAVFHLLLKAATELPSQKGASPTSPDLGVEKHCSHRSAQHLQSILEGTYKAALPEFLYYLKKGGYSLPPEVLPELLDRSLDDPSFWEDIQSVIGARGTWLAGLHPLWIKLIQLPTEEQWQYGRLEERVAYLKHIRAMQPQVIADLLRVIWDKESSKEKKAFIQVFRDGLSGADEAFLEKCLDDRQKDTRLAAAQVLALLEGSSFHKRIQSYLDDWLVFEKHQCQLQIPNQYDSKWKRDGILAGGKSLTRIAKQAYWVSQAIRYCPLSYWEKRLNNDIANTLKSLMRSHTLFASALIDAILLQQNKDWAEALVFYWSKTDNPTHWNYPKCKKILALLSNNAFNSIAINYLRKQTYGLDKEHFIADLLALGKHRWEDALCHLFIRNMQEWIQNASAYAFEDQPYLSILQVAAYHCNPQLFSTLQNGWYYKNRAMLRWEKRIESFLNTLVFRRDMIRALKGS